jgi:hypothetical protein
VAVEEEEVRVPTLLYLLLLIVVIGAVCSVVATVYNLVQNIAEEFIPGYARKELLPDPYTVYATTVSVAAVVIVYGIVMRVGRALRRV